MERSWKRDAAVFLSSQTLSLLGSSLVQYAIIWRLTLDTKSGLMMTMAVLFGFLPVFILSPFAGVWADRHDRKALIVSADGAIALVTLGLAVLYMTGHGSPWLLLGASAARAFGQAVHGPAVGAILPQFVPPDKLLRVNALNGSIQSAIMIVSPMAAGALLTLAPIQYLFFIDIVTAAAAIGLLLAFLKVPPHARALEKAKVGYFHDLRLGLRYVREHRYLLSFFAYIGGLVFMISPAAFLTPLQAVRTYGGEVWRLTGIEIAFSGGMLLGGLALSAWGGFRNRMRSLAAANLAIAACTLAFGLAPPFWLYLGIMGVFGLFRPFWNAPASSMLQEHVEGEYLGRVFGVMGMISTSFMPMAMLVFGPLADLVRIEWILLATGAVMLLQGLLVQGNRLLMEAGAPLAAVPGEGASDRDAWSPADAAPGGG